MGAPREKAGPEATPPGDAGFLLRLGRLLNSGQSRSVVVTGNIYDLFHLPGQGNAPQGEYVPLVEYLATRWNLDDFILVVYEINGPVRFVREGDLDLVREAWTSWRAGRDSGQLAVDRMLSAGKTALEQATRQELDAHLQTSVGNPTLALELLRQLCVCSRTRISGKPVLPKSLVVIIEGADLILPEGDIVSLSDVDRHRVNVCHDWFLDPGFINGGDSVVLLTESRGLLNQRVARLPQVLEVQVPAPDEAERLRFIEWFQRSRPEGARLTMSGSVEDLAQMTAGLTLHAIRQMLLGALHEGRALGQQDVVAKVEEHIQSQLGEDMVEFKKPSHTLGQVVGFSRLKEFLHREFIPRMSSAGEDCIGGAAVCGPIGVGKTFIFEAVAAELDMVVLVLKNIRSQWFGQTDVQFERLRRVLLALSKVLIMVDEADTQFGGVGPDTHETERRLTGKVQAMMSDPELRGRVVWLLMTARIHLLSPDIRRPGRVGDLIIPLLDPEGDDRAAFARWAVEPAFGRAPSAPELEEVTAATKEYAASSYAALRGELKAKAIQKGAALSKEEALAVVADILPPDIGETRRYQTLQAMINCTRRSLLPAGVTEADRQSWVAELRALDMKGVR